MSTIPLEGMMVNQNAFGGALRSVRRDLKLSQEALAAALGSTQRHVSFLETGRSSPTRPMLGRLVAALRLTAAQRAALFEASGFRSPYPHRTLGSPEVQAALDLIERQVLRHWPFPAFVVDRDWTFLRTNGSAARMVEMFGGIQNMHALFLSPAFQPLVENWEPASASFYQRIQEVAARSPVVRDALASAVAAGRFAHVGRQLAGSQDVPVFVPIVVRLPGQPRMQFTSLHGRLVSVHDALAESFEVELMVPLDVASEVPMQAVFGGGEPAEP